MMNKAISSLLVVGLCAAGFAAARPAPAAIIVKGSPFSGKFLGPIPGTVTRWPITITGKGDVSAEVREKVSLPVLTVTWGSVSGDVDADGLLRLTGVEFVRNSGGGIDSTVIDFKANVVLTDLGGIVGVSGSGEEFVWLEHTTTTKK
jgi:hypothetical protein